MFSSMAFFNLLGFFMIMQVFYASIGQAYPRPEQEGGRFNTSLHGQYTAGLGALSNEGEGALHAQVAGSLEKGVHGSAKGHHTGKLGFAGLDVLTGQSQGQIAGKGSFQEGVQVAGAFGGSLKPGK